MTDQINLDILEIKNFLKCLGFNVGALERCDGENEMCSDLIEISIKCTKSNTKYILTKPVTNCSCPKIEANGDEKNLSTQAQQPLSLLEIPEKPITLSPSINSMIFELIYSAISISNGGTLSEKLKSKFSLRHKSLESLKLESKQGGPKMPLRSSTWDEQSPPRQASSPILEFSLTPSYGGQSDDKQKLVAILKAIVKKGEEGCDLLLNKNNTYTKKRISDIKPSENSNVKMGTFVELSYSEPPKPNVVVPTVTPCRRPLLTPKSSRIAMIKKKASTSSSQTAGTSKLPQKRPDTPNPFKTRIIPPGLNTPAGISKIKVSSRIPSSSWK